MARVFFNRWRRDVARLALKTETFEEATQVGSGAAVAIEIDLLALRHSPFQIGLSCEQPRGQANFKLKPTEARRGVAPGPGDAPAVRLWALRDFWGGPEQGPGVKDS